MSEKKYVSWADVEEACKGLHTTYNNLRDKQPDCIVGLTRGGLIPGTILSHLFNVPLVPVCYTSASGEGSKTMYANKELQPLTIEPANGPLLVYVVDEICDSGHTLREVVDYYKSMGYHVITGVLHHKVDAIFAPTYAWEALRPPYKWVVYPWEVN